MSSGSIEPRSIASQLVLLFTAAAALLLGCALGVLYWIVVQHAEEEDDRALADKVFALRAHIKEAGAAEGLRDELQAMHADKRSVFSVRILDAAGEAVVQTPGMGELLPVTIFPQPEAAAAAPGASTPNNVAGRPFALSVAQETAADGQVYTMQVAQDRSRDEAFTNRFRTLLIAVLAGGVLAASIIAATVTKRGLRPLAAMTSSFQRIGPQRLDARVATVGWPRELQPLAAAFDEMLDRLQDSFTRLSQFSADLAHELRTPIANIRGETEVALTRPRSAEDYRRVLESSLGECERLSAIIESLLFLARAEGTDRTIQRTVFDARAAAAKIVAFYQTVAEERHISVTATGSGEISGDPLLFGRALSNLVENALRFTPAGGRISIAISGDDGATRVTVTDTGHGIEAAHLPRIFDRFYRADPSRSEHGTGLGLALVKSIMELHGGSACAESIPQQGTTITLAFPSGSIAATRDAARV